MGIIHKKEHLAVYLFVSCRSPGYQKGWSIDTEFEIDVLHPNRNPAYTASGISYSFYNAFGFGRSKYMEWKKMEKEFLHNNKLVVEIRVKITKMTGIGLFLRRFDERIK